MRIIERFDVPGFAEREVKRRAAATIQANRTRIAEIAVRELSALAAHHAKKVGTAATVPTLT
ncbi:hypothetical protein [Arthrobacter cryoconiti]|uniref:Uncharacterized protein n=1 Tax=Arthrobacter cryoconiti TaxID=748907 RepID=A0ABV8QXX3_9MICC|nr:hypothetical protein [Arthrobacter cryoconiti]MCC9068845.1 hypothetical protein [Arthrobacter cryoconiti]